MDHHSLSLMMCGEFFWQSLVNDIWANIIAEMENHKYQKPFNPRQLNPNNVSIDFVNLKHSECDIHSGLLQFSQLASLTLRSQQHCLCNYSYLPKIHLVVSGSPLADVILTRKGI